MISLTCDISNMVASEKDGILFKLNECLEGLSLYTKTLDINHKQTSHPSSVLVETFIDFYFDKDIGKGKLQDLET